MDSNIKKSFINNVIAEGVFLEKYERKLLEILNSNPQDIKILSKLADVYRQAGELEKARDTYQKILKGDDGNKLASYTVSVLDQTPTGNFKLFGMIPVPYWQKKDFLMEAEISMLWNVIQEKQDMFEPSETTHGLDQEYRHSKVLYKKSIKEIASWFLPKITECFETAMIHCNVNMFSISDYELELNQHLDGDFFIIHRDTQKKESDEEYASARKLTFVYYFHSLPKRYKGGDLLLFDTDSMSDEYSMNYTRIIPVHNCILFFPSTAVHQVTPISLDTDNYLGGRYTLNGWIH